MVFASRFVAFQPSLEAYIPYDDSNHDAAIKALFNPRPPIEPKPPLKVAGGPSCLTGIAALLSEVETAAPPPRPDALDQRSVAARRKDRKAAELQEKLASENAAWNPSDDPQATKDPYATLFVARLNHNSTEDTLRKVFGQYGPIVSCRVVVSK